MWRAPCMVLIQQLAKRHDVAEVSYNCIPLKRGVLNKLRVWYSCPLLLVALVV